ncbi:MAG TPA: hypothetical protein VMF06_17640 [Candidatus Limnocylindria bacterium]|jgi:hypothetical protein|nr:hypothetical protein [Candidatus Limnocylindria bacterium]
MALKFERFTKVGGSFTPIISIRKQGVFGLSQGALHRFSLLDEDWFVVLFYDKDSNVIGILPTKDGAEEGAIKLVKRKTVSKSSGKENISSSVSARSFFEYYTIPLEGSRSFLAKWDEENKMILVPLNDELKGSTEGAPEGTPEGQPEEEAAE